jgi:hypothetical protein
MNPEEINQVAGIFQNLGAEKKQAKTMAAQLIKRADQLAKKRNSSKVTELQTLLATAIYGAQGNLKPSKKEDS